MIGYETVREHLDDRTIRLRFKTDGVFLTTEEIFRLWIADDQFCWLFSAALADAPFEAFFWETPPTTKENIANEFECVLVFNSALVHCKPDPRPFASQFANAVDDVVVFPSLGKDATLVVPTPASNGANYAHLAAFLRTARSAQVRALWGAVGDIVVTNMQANRSKPRWLSTSGLGVHWLHVRIDTYPKYYSHAPYRDAP